MSKKAVQDHLGRAVAFQFPPKRIVSLCPSITETLCDLHLSERIVGRTRYCIHPVHLVKHIRPVGGTKKIHEAVIDELCPDLIIAEKEENPKETVERLEKKYPVFVAEVKTFDDALEMIRDLGEITGQTKQATEMAGKITKKFQDLCYAGGPKVAYVIWKNPYMVAGNDTYIHSVLKKAGFTNAFRDFPGRYPEVSIEDFRTSSVDCIFLASEPFPFQESHKEELAQHVPDVPIVLVDGEICWYGSRMMKAADELHRLAVQIT